mmetsp:Transcript_5236/g.9151  ORF Transcript_5236/g.9151 Transcript_5236/m.9151 type:complete len:96 (+) Transcript_5236:5744-6031(+)
MTFRSNHPKYFFLEQNHKTPACTPTGNSHFLSSTWFPITVKVESETVSMPKITLHYTIENTRKSWKLSTGLSALDEYHEKIKEIHTSRDEIQVQY